MNDIRYLVEELKTGLVDGYYTEFAFANSARESFQSQFNDMQFVVKPTLVTHTLHDSEMINCSEWYLRRD